MPPRKKEEEREEELVGFFEYRDGSTYEGRYQPLGEHNFPGGNIPAAFLAVNGSFLSNTGGMMSGGGAGVGNGSNTHKRGSIAGPHQITAGGGGSIGVGSSGTGASAGGGGGMIAGASTGSAGGGSPSVDPQLQPMIQAGPGRYCDASGVRCECQWIDGRMSGIGSLHYPSGSTYTGTLLDNQYNGIGKYVWPDGSYYDGQWAHNLFQGLGTYVDAKGKRWYGKFFNGKAVDLQPELVF